MRALPPAPHDILVIGWRCHWKVINHTAEFMVSRGSLATGMLPKKKLASLPYSSARALVRFNAWRSRIPPEFCRTIAIAPTIKFEYVWSLASHTALRTLSRTESYRTRGIIVVTS